MRLLSSVPESAARRIGRVAFFPEIEDMDELGYT
jgi:hypothetical protein